MDPNLLDDNNVESEYRTSLLIKIRSAQIPLNILMAVGFLVGIALFFIALVALEAEVLKAFILGIMLIVQMGLTFHWSVSAFNYTRAIKWYDPTTISNRLEHLLDSNSRLWRATALFFLWAFCTLVYTVFGEVIG